MPADFQLAHTSVGSIFIRTDVMSGILPIRLVKNNFSAKPSDRCREIVKGPLLAEKRPSTSRLWQRCKALSHPVQVGRMGQQEAPGRR